MEQMSLLNIEGNGDFKLMQEFDWETVSEFVHLQHLFYMGNFTLNFTTYLFIGEFITWCILAWKDCKTLDFWTNVTWRKLIPLKSRTRKDEDLGAPGWCWNILWSIDTNITYIGRVI